MLWQLLKRGAQQLREKTPCLHGRLSHGPDLRGPSEQKLSEEARRPPEAWAQGSSGEAPLFRDSRRAEHGAHKPTGDNNYLTLENSAKRDKNQPALPLPFPNAVSVRGGASGAPGFLNSN